MAGKIMGKVCEGLEREEKTISSDKDHKHNLLDWKKKKRM